MSFEDVAVDSTMLDYELLSLIAFHSDLKDKGTIKEEDSDLILSALYSLSGKKVQIDTDEEDIHTFVENRVREIIGKHAENLRLFLSRNEQSQCNIKSFYIDHLFILGESMLKGSKDLTKIAQISGGKIAGFTHWKQAMPMSISTYYDYMSRILLDLVKDTILLISKLRHNSPFGTGSGFGSFSPASFESIAAKLGFENGPGNPVATSFYRGFDDIELMSLITRIMIFYSRISADLILYSSGSNACLSLPAAFVTGSSLMPNKRNPDFLEMIQGYTSTLIGDMAATSGTIANRNTGYHREFQISKDKTTRDLLLVEAITKYLMKLLVEMKFDEGKAASFIENGSYSSYDAYKNFERTGKWKESYRQTGNKVRSAGKFTEYEPKAYESVGTKELIEQGKELQFLKKEWIDPRQRLIEYAKLFFDKAKGNTE
ncbi:MAG: lyase family protein [Candidatus Thermoplasmatota archaeon]|nr:lyase family protein [Candidatus Thermoplasmatota archaeon]